MTTRITPALAVSITDLVAAAVDAGAAVSTLEVYSGSRPTLISDALTSQVKLVTYNFPDPGFDAAVAVTLGGQADSNLTNLESPGLATDTATWYRLVDGNGVVVLDGSVTNPAGSGDLKISSTSVTAGINVKVVSYTLLTPKG